MSPYLSIMLFNSIYEYHTTGSVYAEVTDIRSIVCRE